ncbi:MAG: (deoxy)nucleoside triphosphate pyrophosphohydrolase [Spirochaetaceae bacterium]
MYKSVAGIIKKKNQYLLGKRKPGGSIGGKWEFPGGKVKNNESLEDALKREFLEELGVEIQVNELIITQEFRSIDHNFQLYAYNIELLSDDIHNNEHDEFRWFKLDEIKSLNDQFADSDNLLLKYL